MRCLLTQGVTLLELSDGTRVVLSLNDVSFHEGLWQIGLLGADGTRLYSIGFGFTDAGTLDPRHAVQGVHVAATSVEADAANASMLESARAA